MRAGPDPAARTRLAFAVVASVVLRVVLAMRGGQGFRPDELPLPPLAAVILGSFSALCVFLVWRLALRAGAGESEASWAALLAAGANSLFFYSRHLVLYDVSLAAVLGSLLVGLGSRCLLESPGAGADGVDRPARRSALAGLLAGAAVVAFPGNLVPAVTVVVAHWILGGASARGIAMRVALSTLGLGVIVGLAAMLRLPLLPAAEATGSPFEVMAGFLWWSEGPMLVVWLLALAYAGIRFRQARFRLLVWGGISAGIAILFGAMPVLLPGFAPEGRAVRSLVPFVCLLAASGIHAWVSLPVRRSRRAVAATAVIAAIAAVNFSKPLRQEFPAGFRSDALAAIAEANRAQPGIFRMVILEQPVGGGETLALPPHEVVFRRKHPLEFRPYQYDGISGEARAALRRADFSMRAIRLQVPTGAGEHSWAGYPGPFRMSVRFPSGRTGTTEPLVVSGAPGAADFVFVRYVDADHVALGVRNSAGREVVSAPIPVDYSRNHEIAVVAGALVPEQDDPIYLKAPHLIHLRGLLVIALDGNIAVSKRVDFHPAGPGSVFIGMNSVSDSSIGADFSGTIESWNPLSSENLSRLAPTMMAGEIGKRRPSGWNGSPGPLKLRFTLPEPGADLHPLVSAGKPGSGDVVFIIRETAGEYRVGIDRLGNGAVISDRLPVRAPVQEIDVSIGSLMPADTAGIYASGVGLLPLRDMLVIRVEGRPVLSASLNFNLSGTVVLGANTVGSGMCRPYFGGQLVAAEPVDPEVLLAGTYLDDRLSPNPEERAGGFSGPLRLQVEFPRGRPGVSEPIVVSGPTGGADFLFVKYESETSLRFGFDHWGNPSHISELYGFEPGRVYDLVVNFGSWLPPAGHRYYDGNTALPRLASTLYVAMNDAVIYNMRADFHPAKRAEITIGRNIVGGSTTGEVFRGRIRGVSREAPQRISARNAGRTGVERDGWEQYSGPLYIRLQFPKQPTPNSNEPIVTSGVTGLGDFLFVRYEGNDMARLGFDHWGVGSVMSAPFKLNGEAPHTIIVSMGSLFPPPNSALYARDPVATSLRGRMIAEMDGVRLLNSNWTAHPALPGQVLIGANYIGGSSAGSSFTGRVLSIETAPLEPLAR